MKVHNIDFMKETEWFDSWVDKKQKRWALVDTGGVSMES